MAILTDAGALQSGHGAALPSSLLPGLTPCGGEHNRSLCHRLPAMNADNMDVGDNDCQPFRSGCAGSTANARILVSGHTARPDLEIACIRPHVLFIDRWPNDWAASPRD
jgi:hypothetical protein